MFLDIRELVGEVTEYDKKVALEEKKPKSWLKSVSAFANGIGGKLIFGVSNDDEYIGVEDAKDLSEKASELIKMRMDPIPPINMEIRRIENKDYVIIHIPAGEETPYYYVGDGNHIAFVRIGNESVPADAQALRRLVLKGTHQSFDSLVSKYRLSDFTFIKLKSVYRARTGKELSDADFESFGLASSDGYLTNAGALFADESPVRHSRVFCTHWYGLNKASGIIEAVDDKEFSGSILSLLDYAEDFIKSNTKKRWKKLADHRIEMPDYPERAVIESLVNALIHRDYLEIGSEIHIDIFDDRMEIYSPGGMFDGTIVQELDTDRVPSKRRNPVIADVFDRMNLMERRGSGFRKINEDYRKAIYARPEVQPNYYSNHATFIITLYNLNYGIPVEGNEYSQTGPFDNQTGPFDNQTGPQTGPFPQETGLQKRKDAFLNGLRMLQLNPRTMKNIELLLDEYGFDYSFGRTDIMHTTGLSRTSATELLNRLKLQKIVMPSGKENKYQFFSQLDCYPENSVVD